MSQRLIRIGVPILFLALWLIIIGYVGFQQHFGDGGVSLFSYRDANTYTLKKGDIISQPFTTRYSSLRGITITYINPDGPGTLRLSLHDADGATLVPEQSIFIPLATTIQTLSWNFSELLGEPGKQILMKVSTDQSSTVQLMILPSVLNGTIESAQAKGRAINYTLVFEPTYATSSLWHTFFERMNMYLPGWLGRWWFLIALHVLSIAAMTAFIALVIPREKDSK